MRQLICGSAVGQYLPSDKLFQVEYVTRQYQLSVEMDKIDNHQIKRSFEFDGPTWLSSTKHSKLSYSS